MGEPFTKTSMIQKAKKQMNANAAEQ